ncbi:MAG TPA: hypothetical protein G4O13_03830 [Dehalococcoidia bacterium]|nr:hypothetical protein [Dehalococcoidia bacterium]
MTYALKITACPPEADAAIARYFPIHNHHCERSAAIALSSATPEIASSPASDALLAMRK